MPVSINVLNMMRLADCIVRLIDPFKARTGFKNVLPENCNKATNSQIRSKKMQVMATIASSLPTLYCVS